MKKYLTLALLSGFVLYSGNANAEPTNEAQGHASATIVADLTVEEKVPLEFGAMLKGAGDVTISTAGVRDGDNDAKLVTDNNHTPAAGKFEIKGENSRAIKVSLTGLNSLKNGEATIPVTNVLVNFGGGDMAASEGMATATGTEGTLNMFVGGTITVGDDVTPGHYEGTYTVTVNYQ